MLKKTQHKAAFTLIELLVVITIIGILAGIALPVFGQVQEKAQQTKSLASAKQIGLALKLYAGDNDGAFPTAKGDPSGAAAPTGTATTSNEAFQCLFPTYVSAEKLFYTPKSAICSTKAPDEVYKDSTTCLAAGENEYCYITGLTDTSNAALPLIADGTTGSGNATTYSLDRTAVGGVWAGKKAIVIHVDTSGEVAGCDPALKVPFHLKADGASKVSIFDVSEPTTWLGAANKLLPPIAATAATP